MRDRSTNEDRSLILFSLTGEAELQDQRSLHSNIYMQIIRCKSLSDEIEGIQ
jgi:hypothetical protein